MATADSRVEDQVTRPCMDSPIHDAKTALRADMRRRLAGAPPAERAECSRRIVRQIVETRAWREALRVLLFAPLPVEPDLDLLWENGMLTGKQIAYPRVEGVTMRLYHINGLDELESTRWGLREPPLRAEREAVVDDFGIVLVPGLAFDAAGGRLGRGGGFYDRLLAERDPAKTRLIGVGFAFQLVEGTLPMAAHDVRLDEIVTG